MRGPFGQAKRVAGTGAKQALNQATCQSKRQLVSTNANAPCKWATDPICLQQPPTPSMPGKNVQQHLAETAQNMQAS